MRYGVFLLLQNAPNAIFKLNLEINQALSCLYRGKLLRTLRIGRFSSSKPPVIVQMPIHSSDGRTARAFSGRDFCSKSIFCLHTESSKVWLPLKLTILLCCQLHSKHGVMRALWKLSGHLLMSSRVTIVPSLANSCQENHKFTLPTNIIRSK